MRQKLRLYKKFTNDVEDSQPESAKKSKNQQENESSFSKLVDLTNDSYPKTRNSVDKRNNATEVRKSPFQVLSPYVGPTVNRSGQIRRK